MLPRTFHLHMISDATGETLVAIAKAVRVQYSQVRAIEHIHPLVRSRRELERVLKDVEATPGIVLYTIVNRSWSTSCRADLQAAEHSLRSGAEDASCKCSNPISARRRRPTVAGQHVLDADYFRRIEALNFTMLHDDGHLPENLDDADILLVGISRTSKTPTSIYLANRGYQDRQRAAGPGRAAAAEARSAAPTPSSSGLVASAERISQVRQNRVLEHAASHLDDYVDREAIAAEIAETRQLCARHGWPIIDVTRRSIEETAAAILRLYHDREAPVLDP